MAGTSEGATANPPLQATAKSGPRLSAKAFGLNLTKAPSSEVVMLMGLLFAAVAIQAHAFQKFGRPSIPWVIYSVPLVIMGVSQWQSEVETLGVNPAMFFTQSVLACAVLFGLYYVSAGRRREIKAVIDKQGNVRLLEPVHLPAARWARVTILRELPGTGVSESTLLESPAAIDEAPLSIGAHVVSRNSGQWRCERCGEARPNTKFYELFQCRERSSAGST